MPPPSPSFPLSPPLSPAFSPSASPPPSSSASSSPSSSSTSLAIKPRSPQIQREITMQKQQQKTQKQQQKRARKMSLAGRVSDMLVSLLVPLGARQSLMHTSLVQLAVFHFYHTILIFLHILVAVATLAVRQYYTLKNNFMAFLYHHHRTPQLIAQDVQGLAKTPRTVAVVLTYRESEEGGGIDGLLEQVADVASWSIGAGVKHLSVYERTGQLLDLHETALAVIERTLVTYYGDSRLPTVRLYTPRTKTYFPAEEPDKVDLDISFVAKDDGRGFLVELTREYAESAARGDMDPEEITVDLVDRTVVERVIPEPDLVVIFGPKLVLDGFPPWQVRLSEIYYARYNNSVTYNVFLRGIRRYANCKINVGR
ncbi:Decaprenyl diphosphate synthase-like protein [Myxozyma melibiosi]|uniref:ditrans,polycis-polyprenyl diphosphate synthase [(2E,6E)-farnesyldiphosphate specific] n=1 Tax=Myxozyma melibiosi TaxID=54550 RepID=A0ABR1F0R6_9ASCO